MKQSKPAKRILRPKPLKNPITPDIRIRIDVLKTALILEEMTSVFLASLLGVENIKESLSFSNKGSALSFNQKINLLIDIGALNNDARGKYQVFMEIRNQFMHNVKARSYETCFSFTDNKDNYILNKYHQDKKLPREVQLENAFSSLSTELITLTIKLTEKIKAKMEIEIRQEFDKHMIEDIKSGIENAKMLLDKYIEEEMEKGTIFTARKLKGMGTFVSKLIYNHAIKKVKAR